ncbi:MAG: SDR family oxidoreductase [Hyphomonadaceae bacterium]|nr:SDR family oxidoreductase [Hyphomonadaceae bacterium]
MRIFVTGASGFVGAAVVDDLLGAGHRVTGLVRTPQAAAQLAAKGAASVLGGLDDLDRLRAAAAEADAVVHTAFNHDFSRFAENAAQDRRAIDAIGETLAGSDRPFLVTSGLALLTSGPVAAETDPSIPPSAQYPRESEPAADALRARGVRAAVVRLPPSVHGVGERGFVPTAMTIAREKGVSAFVGAGSNRWPAVHRLDAARVYRLALEDRAQAPKYHAVAEEGVPFREIAARIAQRLRVPMIGLSPEEAATHFGWFATFAGLDAPASSALTRERLGWTPVQPALLDDIAHPDYFAGVDRTAHR